MSELTPEKIAAQDDALQKLRALRHERENFYNTFDRRVDDAVVAAKATGLSLRDIGAEIGKSPQTISNWLDRIKATDG